MCVPSQPLRRHESKLRQNHCFYFGKLTGKLQSGPGLRIDNYEDALSSESNSKEFNITKTTKVTQNLLIKL